MSKSRGWIPCIVDPVAFDCSDCSIGPDAPCRYRSDDTLRHERAERLNGLAHFSGETQARASEVAEAAKRILMKQRMALPSSALLSLMEVDLSDGFEPAHVELLLRRARDVRESSPGMFRWEPAKISSLVPAFREDLSVGASIAKMLDQYPPMPAETRREKFKQLAAYRVLRAYDNEQNARESIIAFVDHQAPRVMAREGWRIGEVAKFSSNGDQVPRSRGSSDEDDAARSQLLAGLLAIEMLKDFGQVERLFVDLHDDLVRHNMRLVADSARKYARGGFLQFADLFQAGMRGLLRAMDLFDPYRGFEFSTYATNWIRQSITRTTADQERTIRIPVHAVQNLDKISAVEEDLFWALGQEPSVEEVARESGLAATQVSDLKERGKTMLHVSDAALESVPDERDEIEEAERAMASSAIAAILAKTLTEREHEIVVLRFGLGGREPQTLEEVGKAIGVTRERIRQIEAKALRKLRAAAPRSLRALIRTDAF